MGIATTIFMRMVPLQADWVGLQPLTQLDFPLNSANSLADLGMFSKAFHDKTRVSELNRGFHPAAKNNWKVSLF